MIIIPDTLINTRARFVLVRPMAKNAIETEWQTVNNYAADDPCLLEHLRRGGNYGVLSHNGVCQMDIDDNVKFKETGIQLPNSFTVTRGDSRRGHYYFTCSDCPPESREKFALTFGDVRLGGNWYVVGPGCRHPSGDMYRIHTNLPLANVKYNVFENIISRFGIVTQNHYCILRKGYSDGTSWGDLLKMRCEEIAPRIKPSHIPAEFEVAIPSTGVRPGLISISTSRKMSGSVAGTILGAVRWNCTRSPRKLFPVRRPCPGASIVTGQMSLLH